MRTSSFLLLTVLAVLAGCGDDGLDACLRSADPALMKQVRIQHDSTADQTTASTLSAAVLRTDILRSYQPVPDTAVGAILRCEGRGACAPDRVELVVAHVGPNRLMAHSDTALLQHPSGAYRKLAETRYESRIGLADTDRAIVHEVWRAELSYGDWRAVVCGDSTGYQVGNLQGSVSSGDRERMRVLARWAETDGSPVQGPATDP